MNGEIVVGRYGKLINPYSGTPSRGIRSSALTTANRLPSRRLDTRQSRCEHSVWSNEPTP